MYMFTIILQHMPPNLYTKQVITKHNAKFDYWIWLTRTGTRQDEQLQSRQKETLTTNMTVKSLCIYTVILAILSPSILRPPFVKGPLQWNLSWETTAMRYHLSWKKQIHFWQKDLHSIYIWTCHQRLPVMTDHNFVFLVEWVVLKCRDHCISLCCLCDNQRTCKLWWSLWEVSPSCRGQ